MTDDLFQIALSGGTVLTANKRLARELARRYDQRQAASGLAVWETPTILNLDAWILRQAQRLDLPGTLLTDVQSQRLWEEIIRADAAAAGRDLLQVPQAARRAREAHRLLGDYLADCSSSEADDDHLAFLRWRTVWQERLRHHRWLDRGDLLANVTTAFAAGCCEVPRTLVLAGFEELKPAERLLGATLEIRGCRVISWEPSAVPAATIGVHGAIDMASEVRSCARWARRFLECNPQARLGVVAPHLGAYQRLIERIFRAELDPPGCLSVSDGPESFSLSLGTPLAREGVIRAALRLLAVSEPLRLDEVGWLLRTPYLRGAQTEWLARAATDRSLRERGRSEWRFAPLSRALRGVPRMAAIFAALQKALGDRRQRLPGEWAERFAQLLDQSGWPGERSPSSREFQAIQHLKETLGQLASLDRVAQPLARDEALTILNRLCAAAIFQPEGGVGRLQVLGMLEVAGFEFDALWILGLHEGAFPSPSRPNPFLPLSVQSRLRMPHADALREREFAAQLFRRLCATAPAVVASWPGQLDGAPLRPSPLLRGVPAAVLDLAPSCDPIRATRAAPCAIETLVDDRAMPLPAEQPFAGGTNILKDQALCPFRAFAHHRLHAERLESPDLGIDNLARGNLVHGVLERFWRQVVSHAALLELDPQRQAGLLTAAAEETLQQHERRSRCDLPPRLRALESRRLVAMASVWLALERRRAPFRVAAIEQRHNVKVGRLLLRTRIDRIDELTDRQVAVIDYKTGRPSPRQWLDSRVTEPQLPLYCLALADEQIGAVLFAMVRSREKECAFRGVVRHPAAWPKMTAKSQEKLLTERGWGSFDEIVAHWRSALPALGDAFVDGCAAVDPVDVQQACKYCDLVTFCRFTAQFDSDAAAGGEGGGDD
jgi:probable DNA repair protein